MGMFLFLPFFFPPPRRVVLLFPGKALFSAGCLKIWETSLPPPPPVPLSPPHPPLLFSLVMMYFLNRAHLSFFQRMTDDLRLFFKGLFFPPCALLPSPWLPEHDPLFFREGHAGGWFLLFSRRTFPFSVARETFSAVPRDFFPSI